MFTINLIKQEEASGDYLNKTMIYLVAAILPATAIVLITLLFLGNTAVLASQSRQIAGYDASLVKLSDAVKMQKDFDNEQESIKKNLSVLSKSLNSYTQWSPILVEVIATMPDKMIMTDIQVKKSSVNQKISKSDGTVSVKKGFKNTLSLSLSANSQHNHDGDVREYGNRLRASEFLKGLGLEQITVSQKQKAMDGQKVMAYGIECVFITY